MRGRRRIGERRRSSNWTNKRRLLRWICQELGTKLYESSYMKGSLKDGHPLLVTCGYSTHKRHCGLLFSSWSGQDDKPKKGELFLFLLLLSHIFIPPPFLSILLDERFFFFFCHCLSPLHFDTPCPTLSSPRWLPI